MQLRSQNRHGRMFRGVKVAKLLDSLGTDQGSVPGKYDDLVVSGQSLPRDHQGMSGALLFCLQDEVDSCVGNSLPYKICFMTNDGVYVLGRNNLGCGSDYVRQQRFSADLMQNLGVFGFEARPPARRHNRDGNTGDAT